MWDVLYSLMIMALLAGAGALAWIFGKGYLAQQFPDFPAFAPRPEPRLDVVEHTSVDGKRRLVLIRRDDVEHLIMTGGPVDVVIETGIGLPRSRAPEIVAAQPQATAFSRAARALSQAAGE